MISLYRQVHDNDQAASTDSERGSRLAVWQTGLYGLSWLYDLVKLGRAVEYPGSGYPNYFTAKAKDLLPVVLSGAPDESKTWVADEHDILLPQWIGRTHIDRVACEACGPEEWLLVEAWDES